MEFDEKLMRSVAVAAYRLALNNTPFCNAVFQRMRNPQPGDLVLETSRAIRTNDPDGFGWLVSYDRAEGTGEIERPGGRTQRWENATIVAVPTAEMIRKASTAESEGAEEVR